MRSVLVLGGSGFIGRSLVGRLVAAGNHVIVPTRRREKIKQDLIVLPNTDVVACNLFEPSSLAKLLSCSDVVINLVGILHETSKHSFETVHVEYVRRLIDGIDNCERVRRLIHVSALNASPGAPSRYLRSKGKGEALVGRTARATQTIIRPSVVFGDGDGFFGLFEKLLRLSPVLLLPAPDARLQPIWVEDLTSLIAASINDPSTFGQTLNAAGPGVYSMRELIGMLADLHGPHRPIIGCGNAISSLMATVLEKIPFLPPLLTRDNLASLSLPSVCDPAVNAAAKHPAAGKLNSAREYLISSAGQRHLAEAYSAFRHRARRG